MNRKFPDQRASGVALALIAAVGAGCSAQQGYAGGQAWQRNACERVLDANERQRCLASAATSFEEYERQRREAGGRQ